MAVKRVVADLYAIDPQASAAFYREVFGLDEAMDGGFIVTLTGGEQQVQLSLLSEGGAGTPAPSVSVEVDDLDATLARAEAAGAEIVYGPAAEEWGVRRFFLRDPAGNLVNVLSH